MSNGLDRAVIDTIRNREPVANLAANHACLVQFGRELFVKHYVSPETYSRAVKAFGERDLVDLVKVMALHAKEAMLLAAFDQHLPEGQKPLLPLNVR
jgi:4-carboxymuconolactone decarboxylase